MTKRLTLLLSFALSVLMASASIDSTLIRDTHDSIRISLVTCSPGTEVYEVYGHTALRVEVPQRGIDMAINYGLFSFDAPHFIWRFLRGETDYLCGAIGYPMFEREYTERGSTVTLQTLNLSQEEKSTVMQLLGKNLRPEYRTYRYNFLYNNCSTQARDKVEEGIAGHVTYTPSAATDSASYRSIIHQYTVSYPWLQFGIDYLLGLEADRPIGMREQMFAPEYLQHYTRHAQVVTSKGTYPYVVSTATIPSTAPAYSVWAFPLTPSQAMILLLLIVAVMCMYEFLVERQQWWFDIILYTLQGLMGCIIFFMFFFSGHPTVGSNLHVIYLNPLPLLLLPYIIRHTIKGHPSALYYVIIALLVAFALAAWFMGQYVQPAAWIFIGAILLRTAHNLWIHLYLRRRRHASQQPKRFSFTSRHFVLAVLLAASGSAYSSEVPKVVVGIVIDQLRTDYLEKFAHLYGDGGFKKLLADGCVYTNGYFEHTAPERASAVASVYTGSNPCYHGIIGNRFLDRKSLRVVSSVDDATYKGVNTSETTSPRQLQVTTLTDELKVATHGHANILSIAPDRDAAVLAAGHTPNTVMWLDESTGLWASSGYYDKLPAWVHTHNRRHGRFDWKEVSWEPYFPAGVYEYSVYNGTLNAFEHSFRKGDVEAIKRYKTSACINDEVTHLAKSCITSDRFGRNKATDMLCLGFYAGNYEHASEWERPIELQDIYCRLDRNIADIIACIDKEIGLDKALIFITSTGYSDAHLPDGRLFTLPTGEFKVERSEALLNMYLGALYGTGTYVEGSYLNEIYLNRDLIEKRQLNMRELLDRSADFLCQMTGIKRVYTSLNLLSGSADKGMRESYSTERSGDLILEIAPGWTLVDERWNERIHYNRAHIPVPIIFYGSRLQAKVDHTPTTIASIAPTVSHILRISMPNGCSAHPID